MLKDSPSGYGLITIIFHWVSAPLILFVFGLGVYMRGLDYYSPWYHRGPEIHIALGLVIFLLMSLRFLWRIRSTSPNAIPTISKSNLLAAQVVKILLYVFVFIICITGYLITTAEGQGAAFFDFFSIPATVQLNAHNVDRAGAIHKYLAWTLIAIVVVHAAAAIFHHFVKRDKTLIRMLKPSDSAD
ncbi:cytochrome b [Cellvibrio zantedeschiae]|uniref:Cytochrome b n=1 Tax=Cellvibrio zantedeschiae TaxID=1237077 RepID=A0ABQ3BA90_9GAMM|nr:cytochrome b [Cellvibrio zantedeschiae]GGY86162.1 cytochrome b [Cellvibrio zantedeschiae]